MKSTHLLSCAVAVDGVSPVVGVWVWWVNLIVGGGRTPLRGRRPRLQVLVGVRLASDMLRDAVAGGGDPGCGCRGVVGGSDCSGRRGAASGRETHPPRVLVVGLQRSDLLRCAVAEGRCPRLWAFGVLKGAAKE